jgi:hypothetical protein
VTERRQEGRVLDRVSVGLLTVAALMFGVAGWPPSEGLSGLAGVIVGVLIGLLISRYYAQRASEELQREAERLQDLHDMTMRMIQTASGGHRVETRRDKQGRPTGVHHDREVTDSLDIPDEARAETSPDTYPDTEGQGGR